MNSSILSRKQQYAVVVLSVMVSLMVVWAAVQGATTISNNVSTGGTLTVSGASTLTGAVSASSTLGVTATSSFAGDARFDKGVGLGADNSVAKTLLFSALASAPDSSSGRVYYNSASKMLQLYDGTQWANLATSTGGGLDVSGSRLQLNSLNSYFALGTTTQQGLSMMTLEATSTGAIPLTLVAKTSQTGNLLQVVSVVANSLTNLFSVNAAGGLFSSSTLTVAGLSNLTGGFHSAASSTVAADFKVSGNFSASSTMSVTGASTFATTVTAGGLLSVASTTISKNLNVSGPLSASSTLNVGGTITATSTATTTLALQATGAAGGCIQLKGTNGSDYRMYIGASDVGNYATSTNGHGTFFAVWEAGTCQ